MKTQLRGDIVADARWPGGYARYDKRKRKAVFIIERRVGGQRFHVSTRATTLSAAMEHLRRFEEDPWHYTPSGVEKSRPLYLTAELADGFRRWQLERGNTWRHVNELSHLLAAWAEDLDGVDLRRADLHEHIKPALDKRRTRRQRRIQTIKVFFAYLRKERGLMRHAEDPTLDLPVPKARPAKWTKRKALDLERVRRAYRKLRGPYRDMLLLLTETGAHVAEIERFIREPTAELIDADDCAVLVVQHKNREPTRIPIRYREAIAAAKRLKARGTVPRWLRIHIHAACKAAKVEKFGPGALRHSVSTWAKDRGASMAEISEFLGHKDQRTTRRHYVDQAVPTVAIPTVRLKLAR
jgi:integrase